MNRDDVRDVQRIIDSRNFSLQDIVMGNISEADLSKIVASWKEGG